MKQYKCTKSLSIQKYDEDCFIIENECMEIAVGEIWTVEEQTVNLIGGRDSIHLACDLNWIEIEPNTLNAYFEPTEG